MRISSVLQFTGLAILVGAASPLAVVAQNSEQPSAQTADQSTTQPQQAQSIAEAAKQARDKKQNTPKPVKIVTEDDIDRKNVQPGQQGLTVDGPPKLETDPPSVGAVAAAEAADAAATPLPVAANNSEADALKAQLAAAQKELDLAKRELALQQDTFFSNADYVHDKAGKAKVDALQVVVNDKQAAFDQVKAKLDALPAARVAPKPVQTVAPTTPATPPQN